MSGLDKVIGYLISEKFTIDITSYLLGQRSKNSNQTREVRAQREIFYVTPKGIVFRKGDLLRLANEARKSQGLAKISNISYRQL